MIAGISSWPNGPANQLNLKRHEVMQQRIMELSQMWMESQHLLRQATEENVALRRAAHTTSRISAGQNRTLQHLLRDTL